MATLKYSITWSWQVCDTNMCYGGAGDTAYFQMIQTTDTVKVCYDAFVYFDTMTYVCTQCDTLVYDGFSYSWVLLNMFNPTGINELEFTWEDDGKVYDLLGRELTEIPMKEYRDSCWGPLVNRVAIDDGGDISARIKFCDCRSKLLPA